MSLNVLTQGGGTGGESASIFITGLDENSTVTAVKDGKTVQGNWNSAESRFEITIKEYGMWTVTATDGTNAKTQDVLVDAAVEYEIEMSYVLWLYREGDECEDVTGGYYLESGNSTLTREEDALLLYSTDGHPSVLRSHNTISLGKYTKLKGLIDFYVSGSTYSGVSIELGDDDAELASWGSGESSSLTVIDEPFEVFVTVGGYVRVRFNFAVSNCTRTFRLKKLWLE